MILEPRDAGSTRTTRGRARTVTYRRVDCTGGPARRRARQGDPALFTRPQTVVATEGGARRRPRDDPAEHGQTTLTVPLRPGAGRRCTSASPSAARSSRPVEPDRPTPAARRPLPLLHLQPVRIAFDVSPLSHERTGVNNYILGSLARARRGGRSESGDEVVAFAPTSPAGRASIPEALDGIPRRAAARRRCPARTPGARPGRGVGWPPAERWLGAFDVLHFTDWMYPPQRARPARDDDPRPRAAPLPGVGDRPRTRSMHTRKYANAARDLRRDLRQLGLHRRRRRRDARLPARADRRRAPRDRRRVHAPTGDGGRPRRALPAHGRDARAAQEPRHARRGVRRCSATPELALAVVGGAGWGEQPELDRPGVVRLGRVSDEELARALPRRRGGRLPVALRGLRDADHRGDGLRRAGRRLGAPVAGRGLRRRRRPLPTPRARRRSRPRSARRSAAATSCARTGSRTPRGSRGSGPASSSSRGTSDSRRHRHDAAPARPAPGTARYLRGLLDQPRRARDARRRSRRPRALRTRRGRRALVPAAARPTAPTCSTARPSAGRSRRRTPLVVTVHDLAVLRHPEWFNRWTRTYSRLAVPRVVRAAVAGDRRLRVHEARAASTCSPSRRPRSASCRTRSRTSSRPTGPRAEGDYVLAVGTLEPRKNLAADRGRRRRRAARRRRARLGQRRAARERRRGSARSATRSSRRSTAARAASSTPRSTRASASRSPRRSPAAARSSRAPGARWPSSPATTRSTSTRPTSPRSATGSRARSGPRRGAAPTWAEVAARDARRSTRRSRDPDRRRRARPAAHRRRDLRHEPAARAARRRARPRASPR